MYVSMFVMCIRVSGQLVSIKDYDYLSQENKFIWQRKMPDKQEISPVADSRTHRTESAESRT